METHTCPNGCCTLEVQQYHRRGRYGGTQNRKAGVFIYDPETTRVLLVQSRGHLWGIPKGTIKYGESDRQCAVRELKEETGIVVSQEDFTRALRINHCALYFYMEMPEEAVSVQNNVPNNDANGVGWIKLDCLQACVENGNMSLNHHCQVVLNRFVQRDLTNPGFTVVRRRKSRKRAVA